MKDAITTAVIYYLFWVLLDKEMTVSAILSVNHNRSTSMTVTRVSNQRHSVCVFEEWPFKIVLADSTSMVLLFFWFIKCV